MFLAVHACPDRQALGHRDHGGVNSSEWQVAVGGDQLGHPPVVGVLKRLHAKLVIGDRGEELCL